MAIAVLLHLALSQARRRPLQSGLLVLGVALGVAVVVAIDMANGSAMAAFQLSTSAVAGRATHRIVGGPLGLEESVYTRLRTTLGLREAAPVVEGTVALSALPGETLTLLGVDPFAEAPFRAFLGGSAGAAAGTEAFTAFLTQPGAVFVSEGLAARAGVKTGDALALEGGRHRATIVVAGLLKPADNLSRRALDGMLIADIATAQELLGAQGYLDRVDLILPEAPAARDAALARIQAELPPSAAIQPAGEAQSTVESMTRAFRLNLTALSLLALLVGTFLIFNTVRFSVVQRRPVIATLRALGVTRREIFAMILGEAAVLGALGAVIGVLLGIALGRGAVALVTRTINDLYFTVNVRGVPIPLDTLVRGGLLGVAAAVGAALLPALEATSVPPVTALRRSEEERGARRAVPWLTLGSGACALLGFGLLALPGERVDIGFAGLAGVVFSFALAAPAVTLALMALARPATERLFGPIGRMAPRDVVRSLSRTAVAIAALMVAVCVSIGVSLMVDSFRTTVTLWLASTLRADVFLTSAAVQTTRAGGTLDPGLPARLMALPEVARAATAHGVSVRSPEAGRVDLVVASEDIAGEGRRFLADTGGSAAARWEAMQAGAVIVSEPFARRHALGVGSRLRLVTDSGPVVFPILGVYYDYGADRGLVLMASSVYRAHWRDAGITSIALFLKRDVDADAFARRLQARLGSGGEGRDGGGLVIRSTRGLRAEVLKVFDRAFAITVALQLLAILVAFVGVLASLMALQLERAREHATLRALGMTEGQLGGLVLLETGLVGLTAGLLSWPAGLSLALLLVYVINRRSFGWTILFQLDPTVFVRALAVAVGAALLAGIYPAWRLRQASIVRGLREE